MDIELGNLGNRPEDEQEGELEWDEATDSFATPTTKAYEEELWASRGSGDPNERERVRQSVRDSQAALNVLFEGEYNPTYGPESRYLFDNTKVLFVDGKIEAKRPTPVTPDDDPLAPIINWIVNSGSKALNFASQHLWVLACPFCGRTNKWLSSRHMGARSGCLWRGETRSTK